MVSSANAVKRFPDAGGLAVALLGLAVAGALAQDVLRPPDATPGTVGISGAVLGAIAAAAAPGFRLQMTELVWTPGAYATSHTHPLAQIARVTSGALGMMLQQGAAMVTRGGIGPTPETTAPLALDTEVILRPRDCISYDEFADPTIHTVWNASDETTTIWTADLVEMGKPYTTLVDAQGTPIP